jgi:hypothetical protein
MITSKAPSNRKASPAILFAIITVLALICVVVRTNNVLIPKTSAQAPALVNQGDQEVLNAQSAHMVNVPVTVSARILKILREDIEGTPHQKFLIILSNGSTVLIAHNIQMAPQVPIQEGTFVTIHGDYIWNSKGGLIHWTHHSDAPKHGDGWIDYNGRRYQ